MVVSKGPKLLSWVANTWAGLEAWRYSCLDGSDDTGHLWIWLNYVNQDRKTEGLSWMGTS